MLFFCVHNLSDRLISRTLFHTLCVFLSVPYLAVFLPCTTASIWFEIWGSWSRVKNISIVPGKFPINFNFFRQLKKILFSRQISKTNFDFPGKNWPFTATSGQMILFLLKSDHFRTYSLYMIRYNNISLPVHDPPTTRLRPPRPPA